MKTNEKNRIFVDMDGTLARFHDEISYLERMFEKNFFRDLKPFTSACEAINKIAASGYAEVYILSVAVDGEPPYCRAEKNAWIDEYLPNIDNEHRVFTTIGKSKAEYIMNGIQRGDMLWDDYNKNLEEWQQAGGFAVKCKNNINHKGMVGKLWDGAIISNDIAPAEIANCILSAAHKRSEFCCKLQTVGEYEDDNDMPGDERLTRWNGDSGRYVPLSDASDEQIGERYNQIQRHKNKKSKPLMR